MIDILDHMEEGSPEYSWLMFGLGIGTMSSKTIVDHGLDLIAHGVAPGDENFILMMIDKHSAFCPERSGMLRKSKEEIIGHAKGDGL